MSSTISFTSGWLVVIAWAMCCSDRLAALGRCDEQAALTLADRRDHVDHAAGDVFLAAHIALELQALLRMQGREVLEQDLALALFRRPTVDLVELGQREIAFAVLGRTDLALDRVAGAQVEAPDLRGRHVDVVRPREIRGVRRAQEAESVRQHFECAVATDRFAPACTVAQQREDEFLLAQPVCPFDARFCGHLQQFADVQGLEFGQMKGGNVGIAGRGTAVLAAIVDVEQIVFGLRILGGITVAIARAAATGARGTARTGRTLVRLRCCCQ
jgi:hypothetical protein